MHRRALIRTALLGLAVPALFILAGPQAAAQPTSAAPPPNSPVPTILPPVVPTSFEGSVATLRRPRQIPASQRPELEQPAPGLSTSAGTDPVLQSGAVAAPAPAPTVSFVGLDKANWGDGWPPDTNGDVGPSQYIETVNTSVGIFNKTGTVLAEFTFDSLFSTAGTGTPCDNANQGDPVVVYDALADRWIVADLAWANLSTGPFYECLAVSKTNNPVSGGWWFYAVQTDPGSNLSDYPKLGIWPDGLYMSANMFSMKSGQFKNVRVWAFNRSDLESGAAVRRVQFDLPKNISGATVYSLLPSNLRGTAPPAGRENLFSSIWGVYAVRVWKFHSDWNTLANSTFTGPTSVPIATFSVGPSTVPEQGGNNIETLTYRVMMQAQYRNLGGQESIWLAHTVGNGNGIASVRWYQLDVTGGAIQTGGPVQQGTWNGSPADSLHRFMPSLAVDGSGDMAVGYSVSSSGMKPAIRYAGRLYGDPAGQLPQGEQTLINGTGAQTNNCGGATCTRWGDYTAMTVDPVDNCTFWYTNEYYDGSNNSGGGNWQTRIGSFKFPTCTGSPPITTSTTTSSTTATSSATSTTSATTTTTSSATSTTSATTTTTSSATTTTTTTTTPAPTAPSASFTAPALGSTLSIGTSSYSVSWTENTGGSPITSRTLREFYGPVVNAGNCSGVTWTQAFALSLTSPVNVTGMNPGQCYYWTVTLTNSIGSSTATSGSLLVTPAASFTSPTSGTTIQTSNTTNTIAWNENSDSSSITARTLTEYYGAVVTPGTCSGVTWSTAFALSLTSPVTATGMNHGDCYYWTVSLTNANGLSSTATSGFFLIQ